MPGVLRLLRPTRETPRAIASSSVLPKQPGVGCGVLTTTHPSGRLTPWFPAGRLETFVSRPDPNLGFDTKSNPIPKCVIDVRTHGRNVDNRTGKARRQHPAIFWRVFHESARGSITTNLAGLFTGPVGPARGKPVSHGVRPSPARDIPI